MSGSRYSTISIRLSDDLVDDRGAAIIDEDDFIPPSEDNFDIAPFLEVPPTPPPKSPNRIFGFGLTPKASFSSSASLRQNSASSINSQYSSSQSSFSTYTAKRRSTDDDSSSRYLDSSSSTYSGGLGRHNRNPFRKLLHRGSKATLRGTDADNESYSTPSLSLAPRTSDSFVGHNNSIANLASMAKRALGIGKSENIGTEYFLETNFDDLDTFINTKALSEAQLASVPGFPQFRDPFSPPSSTSTVSPTPTSEKRKGRMLEQMHLISPTTIVSTPPASPKWSAPSSWEVEPAQSGQRDTVDEGTDIDEEAAPEPPADLQRGAVCLDQAPLHEMPALEPLYTPAVNEEPKSYSIHIIFQGIAGGRLKVDPSDTVASVTEKLKRELNEKDRNLPHRLYLREKGKGDLTHVFERILAPNERPAEIMRRRLEQAGFDHSDGVKLLGEDGFAFLLSFVFKLEMPTDITDQIEDYTNVDLSGRSLLTIPVALHKEDYKISYLKLSRNPMLDLPLDFIQSCTRLKELHLSNMAMKKVPASLRYSRTLERLDLSCNRIHDLDDAHLEELPNLRELLVQNNRIEKLPFLFPRLKTLTILNISNNKFTTIPPPVTLLVSLEELDVSFNMIATLPPEIGRLGELKSFTLVGNQVSRFPDEVRGLVSLQMLDCRRNHISDLSIVCMLPQLQSLQADHNAVYALDLCLGPKLVTLDVSHNDITRLALVPGPLGHGSSYPLTWLDLSYGKLSSLDDQVLEQLTSLEKLKLDHNSFRYLPDSLGNLSSLIEFSCSDNKLINLPETIGQLQKLQKLDAHNNSLGKLPESLWNCSRLTEINVTSNFIEGWSEPPMGSKEYNGGSVTPDGSLSICRTEHKGSTASGFELHSPPPLVSSLQKLYLGENRLKDEDLHSLMIFKELSVLNLSFNEIQELPREFFKDMPKLRELYLSGNRLSNIRAEHLPRAQQLGVLFVNGNKLQTLPSELAKIKILKVLDAGSNLLKYNINNYEFDWNWNFNNKLKYLNLSGNDRLYIKSPKKPLHNPNWTSDERTGMLTGFPKLKQLQMLGLMDVRRDDVAYPEKDRYRIRLCDSTSIGMGFGIADTLPHNGNLNLTDLAYDFRSEREGEAVFAIFNCVQQRGLWPYRNSNTPLFFLQDRFITAFQSQREALDSGETIADALRRTFLKLNCDLYEHLSKEAKGYNRMSLYSGATGIALYFKGTTMHVANVGDVVAVISRKGEAELVSRKHHPYDRRETSRIRAAEGWVSPPGLVNGEIGVSRAFGCYHLLPVINARPDVVSRELIESDEFVIVANHGLWDFVPYQTAVDIARTVLLSENADPMIAAQKLRDFAISYGAIDGTMIMVIRVSDLFHPSGRARPPAEGLIDNRKRRDEMILDKEISRLTGEVPPPTGHLALVFTDIRNSTHLWEVNPGMPTAMRMHNNLLRRQLRFCGGYEVKTEGDAFMCSFPNTLSAVWWCLTVQHQLLQENWPLEILECEDGKPIYDAQGRLVARGLSVRMGIHCGTPVCEPDPITRRMDYFGPMVNRSARINGRAAGGQIMCSADVIREINAKVHGTESETPYSSMQPVEAVEAIRRMGVIAIHIGEVKLKGLEFPELLSVIYPVGLEGRHELEEEPAEHNPSGSRVQFSVSQMRELGLVCLRLEALASGRVFRPSVGRKGSIQSIATDESESAQPPSIYFDADPSLLLPNFKETSSDSELMHVLDSLSVRIHNALSLLSQIHPTMDVSKDAAFSAICKAGLLGDEKLKLIASILQNI